MIRKKSANFRLFFSSSLCLCFDTRRNQQLKLHLFVFSGMYIQPIYMWLDFWLLLTEIASPCLSIFKIHLVILHHAFCFEMQFLSKAVKNPITFIWAEYKYIPENTKRCNFSCWFLRASKHKQRELEKNNLKLEDFLQITRNN